LRLSLTSHFFGQTKKLGALVSDNPHEWLRAGLELTLLCVAGKPLAHAITVLEGEAMLAPFTWAIINNLDASMKQIEAGDTRGIAYAALVDFANDHGHAVHASNRMRLVNEVWGLRRMMCLHWRTSMDGWATQLATFKSLCILDPVQFVSMPANLVRSWINCAFFFFFEQNPFSLSFPPGQ
jgi:hypothetical protein